MLMLCVKLIERDRHITYREIQASLGIDMKAIHTILHDHLSVRKLCSRWIPHNLTEAQKQTRVKWSKEMLKKWIYSYEPESKQQFTFWVFQNEPKPTVVRSHSAAKQMIACFFGYTGHVTTVALEDRRTVNTDWYIIICLSEVINELRRINRNCRIILHHDNASCHTACQTVDFFIQ